MHFPLAGCACICITEHYGETSLSAHQERCPGLRKSQSVDNVHKIVSANHNAALKSGQRLGTASANQDSPKIKKGQKSNDEPVKSPPWLLAAEKRLQQQMTSKPGHSVRNSSIVYKDNRWDENIDDSSTNSESQSILTGTTSSSVLNRSHERQYSGNHTGTFQQQWQSSGGRHADSVRETRQDGAGVECPLCGDLYPTCLIERHASVCSL